MFLRQTLMWFAAACLALLALSTERLDLTIDALARGPALAGYPPQDVRWSGNSERVYFRWKQAADPLEKDLDLYVVNRDGTGLRKLNDAETRTAPPASAELSQDRRLGVFVRDGDLFLYDYSTDRQRRITKTTDIESNPHFLPDGQRIGFTRSNNLYVLSLDDGSLVQMTDIRIPGATPTAVETPRGTESQEYLKKEERELLEVVRERARKREDEDARRKRENPRKPLQLQPRQTVASLELSPDERYVIAGISETGEGARNTVVPSYVTESVYTETLPSRAKVGDSPARTRLAILSVETGEVKWVEHDQKSAAPAAPGVPANADPPKRPGRDSQWFGPVWSADGKRAALVARSADNKDRWILALDLESGKTRVIVAEHDDAWINWLGTAVLGWMKNDRDLYFVSERSGFAHLYTVPYTGGAARALTSGKWEVGAAQLAPDKTRFWLTTSETHPGDQHFYTMPADGGERVRITAKPGQYQTVVSRDGKSLAFVYSYVNKPPELFIQENRAGAQPVKVTSSPAPEFWTYPWLDAPIVPIRARDGAQIPARLYKPANFRRGGPAVIFVHGAGYLQGVHHGWTRNYRESMFNQFLMNNGYLVVDVDYRGSAGYGRDWRTAIYRHMGGKDLDDLVDTAKWLVAEHGAGPGRIGLYGGSYGGFLTLMGMFRQPEVFAAGAALRPVTDWAQYAPGYTANILNLPQKDSEAYRRSSPIYFAAGLKGALLLCHGLVDTNVHFQDTARLVQKLIELRKENWELAIYPVEDHGFVQPSSWADEYKRIFRLFEQNLNRK